MNVIPQRLIPTKPEHLDIGNIFLFCGTCKADYRWVYETDVPPQLVIIRSKPQWFDPPTDMWVSVQLHIDLSADRHGGQEQYSMETHLPLMSINVPEHGTHNRHLVRQSSFAHGLRAMRLLNRKDKYWEKVGQW